MAYSALCTSGPEYCLRYVCDVFETFSGGYRKPMRTYSRKRIIVYRKYVMFIKQSPTRFTMVTKNDTKTGHFLIYIFRQIIQNSFLISYYNNIAVMIIIIIQLLGTNSFSSRSRHGPLRNMHYYLMMIEHAHRDAVAKHRINDITHVWYRWYDVLPLWKLVGLRTLLLREMLFTLCLQMFLNQFFPRNPRVPTTFWKKVPNMPILAHFWSTRGPN